MNLKPTNKLDVYLEVGARRTFATALDWPGWCRMGRDEATALQNLLAYGPRYTRILRPARLGFEALDDIAAFVVVERLKGNATTDFGAPDIPPSGDDRPLDDSESQRLQAILNACWRGLDVVVEMSKGKALRTGPRGGGRTRDKIVEHVLGAEAAYLSQLGGKVAPPENSPLSPEVVRHAILNTLIASAHGEIAPYGPRGGKRWLPRFFVRREAWHVLDHLWEIEDRLQEPGGAVGNVRA